MRWTEIRQLRVGDVIVYGDNMFESKCTFFREGEVLHVTLKGGIKVRVLRFGEPTDTTAWVPYHYVTYFPRRCRRHRAAA